ncbi:MAG: glycosyltransferase family 4 protein [Eubacterium sp.]
MKVLFVATVRSHIGQFHIPFIKELKNHGFTVDAAFKDNSNEKQGLDLSVIDNVYEIPFSRSPYSADNIKAYFKLKKIIDNGNYDAVHCHTPMGAVIARLASKKARKSTTKVIYTAHGFHFFKGASKKNWLLYYPVEKILSKYTDCLITINSEDFECAKNSGFKCGQLNLVNGVGVDISKFHIVEKAEKNQIRAEYGYDENDILMIYPADFSSRKNHKMLIKALVSVAQKHNNIRLLLPGPIEDSYQIKEYAEELGVSRYIDFLGYRRDIDKLVGMCDISVSTSRQEGLPVNLIEAMALGNAIVATDVRGNKDLVKDGENGYLVDLDDFEAMAKKINYIIENFDLTEKFRKSNAKMIENYSVEKINSEMLNIYSSLGLK